MMAAVDGKRARSAAEGADAVRPRAMVGVVIAATILLGLPTLLYPLGRDQGAFCYVAQTWLRGGLPYRDAWDIKPPAIYALFAMVQRLPIGTMAACRALDIVFATVSAAMLAIVAHRHAGKTAGLIAGVAFAAAYYLSAGFEETATPESFAAPAVIGLFMLVGAMQTRPRTIHWFAAGLCLSWCLLLKTPLVLLGVAFLPVLFDREGRTWRGVATGAIGLALPVLAVCAYFASHGASSYLVELIHLQAAYSSQRSDMPYPVPFVIFSMLARWPIEFGMLIFSIGVGVFSRSYRKSAVAVSAALTVLATVGLLVIQGRYYAYQLVPILPGSSLLFGLAVARTLRAMEGRGLRIPRLAGPAIASATAGVLVVAMAPAYGLMASVWTGAISKQRYYGIQSLPSFNSANVIGTAEAVKRLAKPHGTAIILGFEPGILAISETRCPSRRFLVRGNYTDAMNDDIDAEVGKVFATNPPDVVVGFGSPYAPGLHTAQMWRLDLAHRRMAHDVVKDPRNHQKAMEVIWGHYEWPNTIAPWGVRYRIAEKVGSYNVFVRAEL